MSHASRNGVRERGFTLPEMLVVSAIVAVMLVIAVPSYTSLTARNALTSKMNEVVGAMQIARSEAVTRNNRVTLCRRNANDTDTCDAGGGWQNGWLVFVDPDADGTVDTGETILGNGARVTGFEFKGTVGDLVRLTYRPDGTAVGVSASSVMTVCKGTKLYEGEITIDATGRPTSKRLSAITNC